MSENVPLKPSSQSPPSSGSAVVASILLVTLGIFVGFGIDYAYDNRAKIEFALKMEQIAQEAKKSADKEKINPTPIVPELIAPAPSRPVVLAETPAVKVTTEAPPVCVGEPTKFEWRVPEGQNKLKLQYKEKNGRLILEYPFPVHPGERIGITTSE